MMDGGRHLASMGVAVGILAAVVWYTATRPESLGGLGADDDDDDYDADDEDIDYSESPGVDTSRVDRHVEEVLRRRARMAASQEMPLPSVTEPAPAPGQVRRRKVAAPAPVSPPAAAAPRAAASSRRAAPAPQEAPQEAAERAPRKKQKFPVQRAARPAPEPPAPPLRKIPKAEAIPPGANLIAAQKRRSAARKFYGTFVLASQSAMSMAKVAGSGGISAQYATRMEASMRENARTALTTARELDPGYVRQQCARTGAVPCNID
jgi:hypothetical protein